MRLFNEWGEEVFIGPPGGDPFSGCLGEILEFVVGLVFMLSPIWIPAAVTFYLAKAVFQEDYAFSFCLVVSAIYIIGSLLTIQFVSMEKLLDKKMLLYIAIIGAVALLVVPGVVYFTRLIKWETSVPILLKLFKEAGTWLYLLLYVGLPLFTLVTSLRFSLFVSQNRPRLFQWLWGIHTAMAGGYAFLFLFLLPR